MKPDFQLETERLIIRPWNYDNIDRPIFHELNNDEKIMEYFPFRRTRAQSDEVLQKTIEKERGSDFGWLAVCLKDSGVPIGYSGIGKVNFERPFSQEYEIGWRFVARHWRKGYASEAASELLRYGFVNCGLEEIIAFAVPVNISSIGVMKHIGMQPLPELDFDHSLIEDDYAHLRRHVLYSITQSQWHERKQ
ncbi:MAG: GNAT family N-acetyltransferase [Rhizobiaceae bacterium]|nr:GNAT family N-acetyltransferase [Rhizobiaceae bacterium]